MVGVVNQLFVSHVYVKKSGIITCGVRPQNMRYESEIPSLTAGTEVAELAVQNYITNDKVNVAGLILAGSADFKVRLYINYKYFLSNNPSFCTKT